MALTRTDLVNELARHHGRENGIHVRALVRALGGDGECDERTLRKLVTELRNEEGMAICGKPETGYFMAATAEELDETCQFLINRGMKSLGLASKLKKVALPDLLGQLRMNQA